MANRVTAEDLAWAATWLGAYEGYDGVPADDSPDSDDEQVQTARRVAAWLRSEVARREERAVVRSVSASTGAAPSRVRERLRAHLRD